MKERYAIVVVGAGPAGCNFARRVDYRKYDVLLLDGTEQRGEKVCAGLLSLDAQDLLAEYDICIPNEILVSPQLFSVRTIDLVGEDIRHYRRSYMNVDRAKFDRFLLDMIPGEVDALSATCKSILKDEKGYTIEVKTAEGRKTIHCDYLIGADGANSIVRKRVFPDKKIERYVSIQQWFEAKCENPYYSCIFDNDTSPSCSWIFFKDGKMVFGGAFASTHCREAFELQKQKLIDKGFISRDIFQNPIKTEACMVSRPHFLNGICRGADNAFLVGEAAGFISPSSLEGISFALASAESLAQAFSKGKNPKKILRVYRQKTRKLCIKVKCKCIKRPFMYQQFLRTCILKTGIGSIKMKLQEGKYESEKFV